MRKLLLVALVMGLTPISAQTQTNSAKVYDITTSGAIGDGKTLNTVAIQATIDKCAASGGGTILIPQGAFLSGAIFLKPGVNLHLDKEAVLQGSTNIADYPDTDTRIEGHSQMWIPALVNAAGVDHLRIDGEGTIQGGGKVFWDQFWSQIKLDRKTKNLDVKRPRNIFIRDSKDVQISGISPAIRILEFASVSMPGCARGKAGYSHTLKSAEHGWNRRR